MIVTEERIIIEKPILNSEEKPTYSYEFGISAIQIMWTDYIKRHEDVMIII